MLTDGPIDFDRPKWHTRLGREADEQKLLIRILAAFEVRVFAVPNEGKRSGRTGAAMVARGLAAGAPDLVVIPLAPTTNAPVVIEMKGKGGKVSDRQRDILERMHMAGWHALLCWGCDDALQKLAKLGFEVTV